ncbi:porin family protein [Marinobacter salicampi]|uniref:porin family protein n=1 Tax=Marinobacter salicampi TaxID=435907 RepID=UPI00140E4446|nr:porin family protein [Marinobacter salicampi]
MKKVSALAAVVLVSGFGACAASAQEKSFTEGLTDNWQERSYAQIKLGFADLGLSDDAMTLTGTYGIELAHIHPQLSAEADLLLTVADAESKISHYWGSTTVEASVFGMGGYLVGSYDQLPIENLVPYVRIGIAYTSAEIKASNGGASAGGDDSTFGLGYGIGARYNLNSQFGVVAEFSSTEYDVLNVGAHYKF